MSIKRTTKILMTATMVAATALSVSPAFASNQTSEGLSSNPSIVEPYAVDKEINNLPISGPTFKTNFNIQQHYGWVKVWIQNTSSETLTVRVTQATLTGTQKMYFTVAPGATWTEKGTKAWATGTHWVSISTKNGGNMSGLLAVKLANTEGVL